MKNAFKFPFPLCIIEVIILINVKLIALGNLKEGYLREAFSEYAKRLSAFSRFECVELKEYRLPDSPSPTEIDTALEDEAKRILSLLSPRAYKIALCIEGKQFSSEELSKKIDEAAERTSEIIFIIGSSHGLSEKVKAACDLRLSISKMTFPHQLMRVVMAEAIYRSFSISKGTKYHK